MTVKGWSDDQSRHIAEVLSELAKQAMQRLGDHFQVQVKANYKATPAWLKIQVSPYGAVEPES